MNYKLLIPKSIKPFLKKAYYQYALNSPFYGAIPPNHTIFIGDGDFEAVGKMIFEQLIRGGLKPTDKLLDVGSGMGRIALPMVNFFKDGGSYDGLEIVWRGVEWCRNKYTKYTNFKFTHADIYNFHYNPNGTCKASEYRFPYEDNSFDFIFLTSVFTHMMPEDVENYLKEIARVMKPGGTSFITYYILDEQNRASMKTEESDARYDFCFDHGVYMLIDENDPEAGIGYKLDYLEDLYAKNNLKIEQPIKYGSWSGRKDYFSFQDVIIGRK
jgi:ubiquinone/menaquinone biosynthesis C-methylase UbiE